MLSLDPYLILLLIACLFILVFGGLSFLRREGLSVQFAVETIILAVVLLAASWLFQIAISPILFLILLYLVTMRSRLVVDLANLLVRRGNYDPAFRLYQLGLTWWPDAASRLIVLTNQGAAQLRSGQTEAAIRTLEGVLEFEKRSRLGLKYEAACRYNLGFAYERNGQDAKAVEQYNDVIELLPGSVFARAARSALERRKSKGSGA